VCHGKSVRRLPLALLPLARIECTSFLVVCRDLPEGYAIVLFKFIIITMNIS
jgi:hypothetical protein